MSEGKSAATPHTRIHVALTGTKSGEDAVRIYRLSSEHKREELWFGTYEQLAEIVAGSVAAPKAQPDPNLIGRDPTVRLNLLPDFTSERECRMWNELIALETKVREACAPKAGEPPQNEVPREFPALRLIRSAEIDGEMEQLSNAELAEKLLSLWAHTDILSADSSVLSAAIDRLRGAGETPAERPQQVNGIEVRRGFGEIELSSLAEDEFVTASGLRDGGFIVYRRLPPGAGSTKEGK